MATEAELYEELAHEIYGDGSLMLGDRRRRDMAVKGDWTDLIGADVDDRPRRNVEPERAIDQRRKMKRLRDCTLPPGFRLVTPEAKQIVTEGQLRWSFVLAWSPGATVRGHGGLELAAGESFYFKQEHEHELVVPDEVQMGWALEAFERELREAGFEPEGAAVVAAPRSTAGQGMREQLESARAMRSLALDRSAPAGTKAARWAEGQAWLQ